MNDVFVTCIKDGRFDLFGRPLVSGLSYTLQWGLARDLWLAGYVSVTDSSVFDAGSVDIRRPNLAAELAAAGVPVPLWLCGLPFVLFAGDGGSNGLLFTGSAGSFTLSLAIAPGGMIVPHGFGYLPANAGGLGNTAGWFYFTMSSDVAGTFYNNEFVPAEGSIPVVPGAPVPFANPAGGRITQTSSEVTAGIVNIAAGSMGNNGILRTTFKLVVTTGAAKHFYTRINGGSAYYYTMSAVGSINGEATIQNAGRHDKQLATKATTLIGSSSGASVSNDVLSFDTSIRATVSFTMRNTAPGAESMAAYQQALTMAKG